MGLARTTTTTFVLLGADCCHHSGEFRPTQYLPMPESINLNPLRKNTTYSRHAPCPGSFFRDVHPARSVSEPFYRFTDPGISHDVGAATDSMRKMTAFDANDDVLVLMAHDSEIKGVLDFWPEKINNWKSKGWKSALRWAFLGDFKV